MALSRGDLVQVQRRALYGTTSWVELLTVARFQITFPESSRASLVTFARTELRDGANTRCRPA